METDATLVRANGIIELNAITEIVLHLAFVVDPGYTECNDAIGLNHAFDNLVAFELTDAGCRYLLQT